MSDKLLEEQIGELLIQHKMTIATAESCTGGLIAHRLTNVAGSSAYVVGGVVAYSNQVKMQQLGVSEKTLMAVGAVSEEVALEMAVGAQRTFQADLALSVTGIAGPGGGSTEKPVGLTYVGMATPNSLTAHRYLWNFDRVENKEASADAALDLLLEYLRSL